MTWNRAPTVARTTTQVVLTPLAGVYMGLSVEGYCQHAGYSCKVLPKMHVLWELIAGTAGVPCKSVF